MLRPNNTDTPKGRKGRRGWVLAEMKKTGERCCASLLLILGEKDT